MSEPEETKYLRELKWLSPAAKTRAGDMVAEGERSARMHGITPPQDKLDAFLFAVGRSRGMALQVVDDVSRALDAASDLAPRRDEGVQETDRGRTFAERIEVLVRFARLGRATLMRRDRFETALAELAETARELTETHSKLTRDADGIIKPIPGTIEPEISACVARHEEAVAALSGLLEAMK